jgi:hypothetical protein
MFRDYASSYGEELLVPRPIPKLEDHPLYAVGDCLFNIFAATLHIVGSSSICSQRTRHDFVIDIHLSGPRKTSGILIDISTGLRTGISVVKLRVLRFSQLTSVTVTSASEIRSAADSVIMMAGKYLSLF